MKPKQETKANTRSVLIDAGLYDQLRAHCDKNGIRFVDFIEDALERATYLDRIVEIVSDADRVKEKIADTQQISVRYGFKRGVLAALLALDGRLGSSRNLIPGAVRAKSPFKTVSGGQLKLFD